jgi:hypothetical protein
MNADLRRSGLGKATRAVGFAEADFGRGRVRGPGEASANRPRPRYSCCSVLVHDPSTLTHALNSQGPQRVQSPERLLAPGF